MVAVVSHLGSAITSSDPGTIASMNPGGDPVWLVAGIAFSGGSSENFAIAQNDSTSWTVEYDSGASFWAGRRYETLWSHPGWSASETISIDYTGGGTFEWWLLQAISVANAHAVPFTKNAGDHVASESSGTSTSPSVTATVGSDDTVLSWASVENDVAGTIAVGTGWTILDTVSNNDGDGYRTLSIAHRTSGSTTAPSWTWTGTCSYRAGTAIAYGAAGGTPSTGTLAATDTADTTALSGDVEQVGTLSATDSPDVSAFTGNSTLIPQNLVLDSKTSTSITMSWDAVESASGYDIERDGAVIATDEAGLSYTDSPLSPGVEYDHRVRAVFG